MSRSWVARLIGICAVLVLGVAGTAYAHLALESSQPANGALLTEHPRELRLAFNEEVELAVARIWLRDSTGAPVALSPLWSPADSANIVIAAISGLLTSGAYTVEWQAAGDDGHPVRGSFSFTIAPSAAGLDSVSAPVPVRGETEAGPGAPGQDPQPIEHREEPMLGGPAFDAGSPAYVAIRWLQYTGLLIAIGAIAFQLLVLRFLVRAGSDASLVPLMRVRAASIGYWASLLMVLSAALRLYAQSFAMYGGAEPLNGELFVPMLTRTVWGWGWMLQVAAAVIAIAGFHFARRARAWGWALAVVGVLVLAVTPALSGHAAAATRLTALAIVADTLHVIGAGGWLGSLLVMLVAGIPIALRSSELHRGANVASLVNAYSPTALLFAGVTVFTGIFAAWLHVGFTPALWESGYGRTLLLKLGVFSMVAATGLYNWRSVRPGLGDQHGGHRIRRSATVELAVGAVVLLVTAVLVATPPAMDEPERTADAKGVSSPR